MKNKKIISKLLLVAFVASFLLQLEHSFEHFFGQSTNEICEHKPDSFSKKQITHSHIEVEQCKVCAFSVSSFIEHAIANFTTNDFVSPKLYCLPKNNSCISFYKGSHFLLRGPPISF